MNARASTAARRVSPVATAALSAAPTGADALLDLYERMLLLRRFELAAQDLYKKGRIPGFIHLYIGQEAVAVGVCAHLHRDDWITSTHRGHGHALAKGTDPKVLMAELYGKSTGCCGGRGGSMHLYEPDVGLLGTNGFVGGGIPSAVGAALSAQVRGTDGVAVAFFGDGAVNHGSFHESLNFAAARNAPVLFVCENNLYATATPLNVATRNTDVASRGAAYGIPGVSVDGNDVVAVAEAAAEAARRARAGEGPTLVEARTYRTVGHHEGDPLVGTYRTQQELDEWKGRDPIARLRDRLANEFGVGASTFDEISGRVDQQVREAVDFAESSPLPDPATVNDHVWAASPFPPSPGTPGEASGIGDCPRAGGGEGLSDPKSQILNPRSQRPSPQPSPRVPGEGVRAATPAEQTWLDAVRDGIAEEMRANPHLIYLGEGIGERGGSFAHTKNLWHEFGPGRVIDTPICELGFTGAAAGAGATGCVAVADLMFADFIFEAATQIVQQAAKLHYMSNGRLRAPLVVRAGMGAIKSAGPHHSGCYHPVWAHCPGLFVVVPSNPADAKGLMKSALRSGSPVVMLEHKMLFAGKGPVPAGEHLVPFGQAAVVRPGRDLTIASCGLLLHRCVEAAAVLEREGVHCEVIDLRTIVPLDVQTVAQSVSRTHRLLVVDEAFAMCGVGAELAAAMMELAFDELDAPVGRLHTDPVAQPFSPPLENAVVVSVEKIVAAARQVIAGRAPVPRRAEPAGDVARRRGAASPVASSQQVSRAADALSARMSDLADRAATPEQSDGVPLLMPNQDLTVNEATVLRWLKKVGDAVRAGEEVVEVETAKATLAVESPAAGTLLKIDAAAGTVVPMGGRLGLVRPQ